MSEEQKSLAEFLNEHAENKAVLALIERLLSANKNPLKMFYRADFKELAIPIDYDIALPSILAHKAKIEAAIADAAARIGKAEAILQASLTASSF